MAAHDYVNAVEVCPANYYLLATIALTGSARRARNAPTTTLRPQPQPHAQHSASLRQSVRIRMVGGKLLARPISVAVVLNASWLLPCEFDHLCLEVALADCLEAARPPTDIDSLWMTESTLR